MAFTIEQVNALAPGLPRELAETLLDAWVESGDFVIALARMRSHSSYDDFFPGNRRSDGSLRHDEYTYLSIRDSFDRSLLGAGINPQIFHERYAGMIAGAVSPAEFDDRVEQIKSRVLTRSDELRQQYAALTGLELDDASLIASMMDPNLNRSILDRTITMAEIGAEGTMRGLGVDVPDLRAMFDFNITPARAAQLFSQATDVVPLVDRLAQRHLDADDTFDLSEFLQAFAFDDPLQRRRISRLIRAEESSFTARTPVAAQGEQITGLVAR